MTRFYQDIKVKKTEDLATAFVQVHLGIVETKKNIAVAFPQYRYNEQSKESSIGLMMRVFAETEDALSNLRITERMKILTDKKVVYPIKPTPNQVIGYCSFHRVQKKSKCKLRRNARRAFDKGRFDSFEDALAYVSQEDTYETRPSLYIYSFSTQKNIHFNIQLIRQEKEVKGSYSSYGLSPVATVPVF